MRAGQCMRLTREIGGLRTEFRIQYITESLPYLALFGSIATCLLKS